MMNNDAFSQADEIMDVKIKNKNMLSPGLETKQSDSLTEGNRRKRKISKRTDALSWDDYFMSVAFLSSMRSKDPNTQVGACIVNDDKRIVGIGYNGFPRGCSDEELPWDREAESDLDTKYFYVCHAEVNAILNKNCSDVRGCSVRRLSIHHFHSFLLFCCLLVVCWFISL
jgi:deoxycytidylate deaminase